MTELSDAKGNLYSLLLKKAVDELTDNEVDIMYLLAKDEQIQKRLRDRIKEEKNKA